MLRCLLSPPPVQPSPCLLLSLSPSLSPSHPRASSPPHALSRRVPRVLPPRTRSEVSNLYPPEELGQVRDAMRDTARAAGLSESNDILWGLFVERVRANMHIVLCMSPIGENYRNYVRMFPALVSCTTINWFSEWPSDALKEVAAKFLEELPDGIIEPDVQLHCATVFALTQTSVITESASMRDRLGRPNYVTPTNYLELVKGYTKLLGEKRAVIGDQASKLKNGLQKLSDTAVQVGEMSIELVAKKKVVAKAQADTEELLVVIVQENHVVAEQQKAVGIEQEKIAKDEVETRKIADDAQADLDAAMPAMNAAVQALNATALVLFILLLGNCCVAACCCRAAGCSCAAVYFHVVVVRLSRRGRGGREHVDRRGLAPDRRHDDVGDADLLVVFRIQHGGCDAEAPELPGDLVHAGAARSRGCARSRRHRRKCGADG